jgi:hypothetical protein
MRSFFSAFVIPRRRDSCRAIFLGACALLKGSFRQTFTQTLMIAPETFNHIENIKKRAGHLWRFL